MDFNIFTQYYGFDWLALLLGIFGIWKLGDKKRSGFIFYMLAAVAGFIFAMLAHTVAYMIVNALIFTLQLRAYLKWRKEEISQQS